METGAESKRLLRDSDLNTRLFQGKTQMPSLGRTNPASAHSSGGLSGLHWLTLQTIVYDTIVFMFNLVYCCRTDAGSTVDSVKS